MCSEVGILCIGYYNNNINLLLLCFTNLFNHAKIFFYCNIQVVKLVEPCNIPGTEVSYFPYATAFNKVFGNPEATEFLTNYEILGETAYPAPFLARF